MTLSESHVVYAAPVELYTWAWTPKQGMRIKLRLAARDDLKHFEREKVTKKGRSVAHAANYIMHADGDAFRVWYITCSWSPSAGALVTFELEDDDDFQRFRLMPTADGASAGLMLDVVLVEMDEEGNLVDQARRAKVEEREEQVRSQYKGGPKSKRAARLMQDPDWLEYFNGVMTATYTEKEMIVAVREYCGVSSRAELDYNDLAWAKFQQLEGGFVRARRRAN